MKGCKFFLYILIGVLVFSCDKNEDPSLPAPITDIINTNFPELAIERVGFFDGFHYVMLEDGTEIKFTKNGEWRYARTTNKTNVAVNTLNLVHSNIKNYFEGEYKTDLKIIDSMAIDTSWGYTFRLTYKKDSAILTFDKLGILISTGGEITPVAEIQNFISTNFPGEEITKITSELGNYVVKLTGNLTIIFTGTGKDWISIEHSELIPEKFANFFLKNLTKQYLIERFGSVEILKKIEKNKDSIYTIYTQDSKTIKFKSDGEPTTEEKIKDYFADYLPDNEILAIDKNFIVTIKNDQTTLKFSADGILTAVNNPTFITPNILVAVLPTPIINVLKDEYTVELNIFKSVTYNEETKIFVILLNDGSAIKLDAEGNILEQTLTTDQAIQKFFQENYSKPVEYTKKQVGENWEVKFADNSSNISIVFNTTATNWFSAVSDYYYLDEKLVKSILPLPVANVLGVSTALVYEIERVGENYRIVFKVTASSSNSTDRTYTPEGERIK